MSYFLRSSTGQARPCETRRSTFWISLAADAKRVFHARIVIRTAVNKSERASEHARARAEYATAEKWFAAAIMRSGPARYKAFAVLPRPSRPIPMRAGTRTRARRAVYEQEVRRSLVWANRRRERRRRRRRRRNDISEQARANLERISSLLVVLEKSLPPSLPPSARKRRQVQ